MAESKALVEKLRETDPMYDEGQKRLKDMLAKMGAPNSRERNVSF
jgi:hypothetical protein